MYRHHNPTPEPETVLEWIAQRFAERDNAPGTLDEWLRDLIWDDGRALHAWLLERAARAGYLTVHIRTGRALSATAIIPGVLLTPKDPRFSN